MSPGLSRKDRLRLGDIKVASETIADHLALLDAGKTPESVLLDAIKYNLVAIGEAANHTSEDLREEHDHLKWSAIVGLRNVLTHEYFRVKPDVILQVARDSVPHLLDDVRTILGSG